MPKSSHSSTLVPHRGPRHGADPDRRVKWVLRFRRKGEEVTPLQTVVRRHRRSTERDVSPAQHAVEMRRDRKQARRRSRDRMTELASLYNVRGQLERPEELDAG